MRRLVIAVMLSPLPVWSANQFVLIDSDETGHGPYALASGTAILNDTCVLEPRGQSATIRSTAENGPSWGPFFITNQAAWKIADQDYRVLLTTPDFQTEYEIGMQTHAMQLAVQTALTNADARVGLTLIETALAHNDLYRNKQSVTNAFIKLAKQAEQEEAMRAAGKELYEGQWLPTVEVEKRRQKQETETMQAQGLIKMDGEWLTIDAAQQRRLAKAKDAAQKAAEERRQFERTKCRRCNGTGAIYFEIRPSMAVLNTRGGTKMPDIRIEKPGLPPKDSKYQIERDACPDCDGTGKRK